MPTRVAIVGAGIAGLACADHLSPHVKDIVLFDKGRRPGGRLTSVEIDEFSWDIGAPCLVAHTPQFREQVTHWQKAGWVAPWPDGPREAMVGIPSMGSLVAAQCSRFNVRFGSMVRALTNVGGYWMVEGDDFRDGPFDSVAIAVPAEQAAPLLSLHDLDAAREAVSIRSAPSWTVMVAFSCPIGLEAPYTAATSVFSSVIRNQAKPGRGTAECWLLHANTQWSLENLECEAQDVANRLFLAFGQTVGIALPTPSFLKAHKWRFAVPSSHLGASIWNPRLRLGACGDWCMGSTIESAWLSGVQLGERMLGACGTLDPNLSPQEETHAP